MDGHPLADQGARTADTTTHNALTRVPGSARAAKSQAPGLGSPCDRTPVPAPGRLCRVLPTPFAESILDVVGAIPAGHVATYGDIAELVGSRAPRAVGTTLARYGAGVPWWRVVRAGGWLAPGHEVAAAERLRAEGVPILEGARGPRVDLATCRWTP